MESPICFRILMKRNFEDIEIKISKCNRTIEHPGVYIYIIYIILYKLKTNKKIIDYGHLRIIKSLPY